jgi:serine/threonine protein kinase
MLKNDCTKELDNKYYILDKIITGASTKISLCYNLENRELCIIKMLRQNGRTLYSHIIENEIEKYKALSSPHIPKLIDYNLNGTQKENGKVKKKAYIIIEYMSKGDLLDYVLLNKKLYIKIARYYFKQLIDILEAMHSKGICHRDIKIDNLMLDRNFNLKLIDFEFSTEFREENGEYKVLKQVCGTSHYMAPEFYNKGRVEYQGDKVDIFSAGVVLFIMLTGVFPFSTAEFFDKHFKHIYLKEPNLFWAEKKADQLDRDAKDLIIGMFSPEPSERLTLSDIKKSGFYNQSVPMHEEVTRYMNDIWLMIERNKQIIK